MSLKDLSLEEIIKKLKSSEVTKEEVFSYFLKRIEKFDDKIQSSVSNQFWKIDGIEDNVFAILENTKSNITASLHSTMTQWRHLFSFEIFLEDGSMILNGLKTPSGAYGEEDLHIFKNDHMGGKNNEEVFKYPVDGSWVNEIELFFDSITNNTPIVTGNSKDAMEIMKLIEEIYEKG
jgi:predicted dehydrogenase